MKFRLVLLIAIHNFYEEHKKLIKYALQSVANQIRKPDHVYISYSGLINDQNVSEWNEILKEINHDIYGHQEKKMQFEHYSFLSKKLYDNDIISFMDDDDLLDSKKFEWLHKEVEYCSRDFGIYCGLIICHKHCIFLDDDYKVSKPQIIKNSRQSLVMEYVNLNMSKSTFDNIMNVFNSDLFDKKIKTVTADRFFGCVAEELYKIIKYDDILYYYRRHKLSIRNTSSMLI